MSAFAEPVTPVRLALHRWGRGPRRALLLHGLTSSEARAARQTTPEVVRRTIADNRPSEALLADG